MKYSKVFLGGVSVFVLASLAFSWTAPSVSGEDYYGEDPNKKILKNALLGAGVGAISASASGGKAGKGALIGAGTNVIGGALLDTFMGSGTQQQQQPVYYQQQPVYVQQQPQYTYQPQQVEYRPVSQPQQQSQSPYSAQTSYNNTSYNPPAQTGPSPSYGSQSPNDAYFDDEEEVEKPKAKKKTATGGCARKEDLE